MLGVAVAAGAALALISIPAAHAGTGNQYCDSNGVCPNAWNGGPFVKGEYYPATNNDFTFVGNYSLCNGGITTSTCPGHGVAAGQGIGAFEFTGGGSWNGMCIGDAYNQQGRADSSLDPCPGGGNGNGGWGVNFVYDVDNTCGGGQVILYDIHWNGYLRYPDSAGSTVYLNNSTGACLRLFGPS